MWSGKRDSNSRPQPWQGCALPTELLPQIKMSFFGEEEETRTPTSQLTLPPQSSASTNSATSPSNTNREKRVPRTGLEPARLAAHAPETCASTNSATWAFFYIRAIPSCLFFVQQVSGKRDSDPRPQPWQGCALPTELFPQISFYIRLEFCLLEGAFL